MSNTDMIRVCKMEPFYTKVTGSKLRLVFAYQYFSIMKEDETFHFIPIEGKEIIVDMNTKSVENLSEVFVFQRGNRFIRLPLYQLLLVSNIGEHLDPLIDRVRMLSEEYGSTNNSEIKVEDVELTNEISGIIDEIVLMNRRNLIDMALDNKDYDLFMRLTSEYKLDS